MKYALAAFALLATAYGSWALGLKDRAYIYCDAGGNLVAGGPVDLGKPGFTSLKIDCK